MARLVLEKFGDLTDNFAAPHARRKVLAGIVMTTGNHVGGVSTCLLSRLIKVKCFQSRKISVTPAGGHFFILLQNVYHVQIEELRLYFSPTGSSF